MPLASLLLPPSLLAVAALIAWCLRPLGLDVGRPAAAAASWLALAFLGAAWFGSGGTPLELTAPSPLGVAGLPLVLRLDGVTVFLWVAALVPAGLLLTFQRRTAHQAAVSAL